jgi:hypothetical protein
MYWKRESRCVYCWTMSTSDGDEKQLCLNCLSPNSPVANFCGDCGAPLSSYAATGPIESIFAEGHVYRKAVSEPKNVVVLVGVWLLFAPTVAFGLMPLFRENEAAWPGAAMALLLVPISVAIIWKTTRRYFSRKVVSQG